MSTSPVSKMMWKRGDTDYLDLKKHTKMSETFYIGRRQYLVDEDSNCLEPPQIFKTKRQVRSSLRVKDVHFQQIMFQKKDDGPLKIDKSRYNRSEKAGYVLEYLGPEDWTETFQAGCKLWINKHTGYVSDACPWIEKPEHGLESIQEIENSEGTGALVYNDSDYKDFLDYLDKTSSKSPPLK